MNASPHLAVWEVDPAGIPEATWPEARLRFLIRYAILAPSSHNAQPWLFSIRENGIDLYADRSRNLRTTDPHGRQMVIGCGCALHHLGVAMRHFGHQPVMSLQPDADDPDLLARVTMGDSVPPTDQNEGLFDAIPKRRTNRQLYEDTPLPEGLEAKLSAAVEAYGCGVHFSRDDCERVKISGLIAAGDKIQWSDKRFRLELAAWTHPNSAPSSDGIPNYAMNHGDLLSLAGPLVIRTFDLGDGQAAKDSDIARYSPALLVINSVKDDTASWLATGQALSHALLLAGHHGVSASFLNQPIETDSLRPMLANTIGRSDYPQIILRMGIGPYVNPTPRRTVDEVTI